MASELTVIILRFAFLALLWFFVFLVLAAARRDLGLGKNFRTVSVDAFASPALPAAEQAPVAAPPARPSQLVITEGAQAGAMMQLGMSPSRLDAQTILRFRFRMTTPRDATRACSRRAPVGSLKTLAQRTAPMWTASALAVPPSLSRAPNLGWVAPPCS